LELENSGRFWQTFVKESPVKLRRVRKLIKGEEREPSKKKGEERRINPEKDRPLKDLFEEFNLP